MLARACRLRAEAAMRRRAAGPHDITRAAEAAFVIVVIVVAFVVYFGCTKRAGSIATLGCTSVSSIVACM